MSIAGYFGRESSRLRMPREADEAGIEYEGDVLSGKSSLEQARAVDGRRFGLQMPVCREVEEYDAVLRWHCRL